LMVLGILRRLLRGRSREEQDASRRDPVPSFEYQTISDCGHQPGDKSKSGRATYLPPVLNLDPTPQQSGPFPPLGFVEIAPVIGTPATDVRGPVLRRAIITNVQKHRVEARVEYRRRVQSYTRRKDGTFRPEGEGRTKDRLVIGIASSNLRSFKRWYSESDLAAGPILDSEFSTDVRTAPVSGGQ